MTHFSAANKIDFNKNLNALIYNLSPTFAKNISPKFFEGKLETFLTCQALASQFKESGLDENTGNFFEETSLHAVYKTLTTRLSVADVRLMLSTLPKILSLNYSVVEKIRIACINLIQELQRFYLDSRFYLDNNFRNHNPILWQRLYYLNVSMQILQTFDKA